MTLDRYVLKLLLTRTVFAIVVLIALVQVLEMFDVMSELLNRGLGVAGIGRYALLRLPGQFQQVSALAVLVGSIFTFGQLARNSEMVVIRATGANIYRVLKMMLPGALAIALVDFTVAAEIAPRTQAELRHWMAVTTPPAKKKPVKAHWFRLGSDLILVNAASDDGRHLKDLHIYRRDRTGLLTQEIVAPSATVQSRGWRLHQAATTQVGSDTAPTGPMQELDWKTSLTPSDVVRLFRAGEEITSGAALMSVVGAAATDRSPGFYQTRLYRTFAEPLGALVMLLLSAPAALTSLRSDQSMRLFVFGISSGLLFLVLDGLLTAMGETSALPPLLAAWSAPVAFTALAFSVLLWAEG